MAAEQIIAPNGSSPSPARYEHLLDLLDAAATSQNGLIFLEDGIDATPLKVTYAELRDRAKVCMSEDYTIELPLTKSIEIWHCLT